MQCIICNGSYSHCIRAQYNFFLRCVFVCVCVWLRKWGGGGGGGEGSGMGMGGGD